MQGAKCKDQWVPQQYCFSQYYWMCANGSKRGAKAQQYGKVSRAVGDMRQDRAALFASNVYLVSRC